MHIVVQEGEASISLTSAVQAQDDSLRSNTINQFVGSVKVYYRDFEVVHVEARDGALELTPSVVGAITWLEKGRRYQLKHGD